MIKRILSPFLLAFVLPLVAIYAWWGGFTEVTITKAQRGPYTYAYLEQAGDYSKLQTLELKADQALRAQGIIAGAPITVLLSNPDTVIVTERRGRVGFLVPLGTTVQAPLAMATIPARQVLSVTVQAGRGLAPGRAYAALDAYLQKQGRGILMPTVEHYAPAPTVYRMGVFTLEMGL
ncbi:MAG: hypothetical protein D4R70_06710 [Betaproteobacteria bacterium]|nr:MAG: hypothetical protein D4R70_06710 [Betaproteobacteria bacterium]